MELAVQPNLQCVEGGFGLGLSDFHPFIGRRASRRLLDRIECGDPRDGLVGDGGALGLVDIDKFAPNVG